MPSRLGPPAADIGRRFSVLDGEHEHRTGLGLARAHPTALAGLVPRPKNLMAAFGSWADRLAAQIVLASDVLLPGLSGALRSRVRPRPHVDTRRK